MHNRMNEIMEKLTETLEVEGMTCTGCMRRVRQALESVDGVVIEDLSIRSAEITYDPSVVNRSAIVDAIRDEGYEVE